MDRRAEFVLKTAIRGAVAGTTLGVAAEAVNQNFFNAPIVEAAPDFAQTRPTVRPTIVPTPRPAAFCPAGIDFQGATAGKEFAVATDVDMKNELGESKVAQDGSGSLRWVEPQSFVQNSKWTAFLQEFNRLPNGVKQFLKNSQTRLEAACGNTVLLKATKPAGQASASPSAVGTPDTRIAISQDQFNKAVADYNAAQVAWKVQTERLATAQAALATVVPEATKTAQQLDAEKAQKAAIAAEATKTAAGAKDTIATLDGELTSARATAAVVPALEGQRNTAITQRDAAIEEGNRRALIGLGFGGALGFLVGGLGGWLFGRARGRREGLATAQDIVEEQQMVFDATELGREQAATTAVAREGWILNHQNTEHAGAAPVPPIP